MKLHYTCNKCKSLLLANTDNFYPSSLERVSKNLEIDSISRCKQCDKEYSAKWRADIKEQGLTRSRKKATFMSGAVTGTIYVIGPDIPGTPYKIGITSGAKTDKRKSSLQTAHWLELKEVWKSSVLPRADLIEKKLHNHFKEFRVRGEWFNITRSQINEIPALLEQLKVKE